MCREQPCYAQCLSPQRHSMQTFKTQHVQNDDILLELAHLCLKVLVAFSFHCLTLNVLEAIDTLHSMHLSLLRLEAIGPLVIAQLADQNGIAVRLLQIVATQQMMAFHQPSGYIWLLAAVGLILKAFGNCDVLDCLCRDWALVSARSARQLPKPGAMPGAGVGWVDAGWWVETGILLSTLYRCWQGCVKMEHPA